MDRMNTAVPVIEALIAKKEELHVTNAWIAEKSKVPESTVTKVFNRSIKSPTFDTLAPIARVLDVSLDTLAAAQSAPNAPTKIMAGDHFLTMLIDSYTEQLRTKHRWLLGSVIVNLILAAVLVFVLVWDLTHPDLGWIQYAKALGWMEIGDWLRGFFAL